MRSMVTGSTGFLGSHIVDELLENGYEVRAMVRATSDTSLLENCEGVEIVVGDITQTQDLPNLMKDIDVLFHNAAVMEADWGPWSKFEPVNVIGTRNVLEATRKVDIPRIAYTSSSGIYGFVNSKTPLKEDASKKPFLNYQKSKWLAEKVVDEYVEAYGLNVNCVRPATIIGSRDAYLIPIAVDLVQRGRLILIGSGKQRQSFVHARDVSQCLRLTTEIPKIRGEAFNITSFDAGISEFYEQIATLLGEKSDFRSVPYRVAYLIGAIMGAWGRLRRQKTAPFMNRFRVKLFGQNFMMDPTKAKEILGFQPRFNLESSIRESLQWYFSKHPDQEIPEPLR